MIYFIYRTCFGPAMEMVKTGIEPTHAPIPQIQRRNAKARVQYVTGVSRTVGEIQCPCAAPKNTACHGWRLHANKPHEQAHVYLIICESPVTRYNAYSRSRDLHAVFCGKVLFKQLRGIEDVPLLVPYVGVIAHPTALT